MVDRYLRGLRLGGHKRTVARRTDGPETRSSSPDRLEDDLGHLGTGEVLLAGHQVAVADREGPERARLQVVRAALAQCVLDAPGHDAAALGQRARLPGHPVRR